MRLICPKCAAQYQVPDDAIPRTGRDVQCSNCGETWYAMRDDEEFAAAATELTAPPDAEPEPLAGELPEAPAFGLLEPGPEPEKVAEGSPAGAPATDHDPEGDEKAAGSEIATEALARRRSLAPDVAQILREEAEREAQARRATAETFEDQPDLGLEPPPREPPREPEPVEEPPAVEHEPEPDLPPEPEPDLPPEPEPPPDPERGPDPERVEAPVVPPPAPMAPVAARATSRHADLPDAGEINSTLRRPADRPPPPPPAEGPTEAELAEGDWRRGFRLGFAVVVLAALALALIYAQAPRIAEAVPALAPVLDGYAGTIDTARVWLDLRMQDVLGGAEG